MALDPTVEVFRNEYLPEGAADVDAIVTVTTTGAAAEVVPTDAAEVVIVDTSASMVRP